MTLPCIICDKNLANAVPFNRNQPNDGTTFRAKGQYGSTVWDPMDQDLYLEVNICDPCLIKAADKQQVDHVCFHNVPQEHAKKWKPHDN